MDISYIKQSLRKAILIFLTSLVGANAMSPQVVAAQETSKKDTTHTLQLVSIDKKAGLEKLISIGVKVNVDSAGNTDYILGDKLEDKMEFNSRKGETKFFEFSHNGIKYGFIVQSLGSSGPYMVAITDLTKDEIIGKRIFTSDFPELRSFNGISPVYIVSSRESSLLNIYTIYSLNGERICSGVGKIRLSGPSEIDVVDYSIEAGNNKIRIDLGTGKMIENN